MFERALRVVVTTWLPALRVAMSLFLTTWVTFTVLEHPVPLAYKTVKRNLALLVHLMTRTLTRR